MLTDPSLPSSEGHTPPSRTFYVLVRRDLTPRQQLVQAVHAAAEAGRRFYRVDHGIASAIVLTVPDAAALSAARNQLTAAGISTDTFYEPDFGIGESALATEPIPQELRVHLRAWPLWRPVPPAEQDKPAITLALRPTARSFSANHRRIEMLEPSLRLPVRLAAPVRFTDRSKLGRTQALLSSASLDCVSYQHCNAATGIAAETVPESKATKLLPVSHPKTASSASTKPVITAAV